MAWSKQARAAAIAARRRHRKANPGGFVNKLATSNRAKKLAAKRVGSHTIPQGNLGRVKTAGVVAAGKAAKRKTSKFRKKAKRKVAG